MIRDDSHSAPGTGATLVTLACSVSVRLAPGVSVPRFQRTVRPLIVACGLGVGASSPVGSVISAMTPSAAASAAAGTSESARLVTVA